MKRGTKYDDSVRYSDDQIERLIPTVWDEDHVLAGPVWKGSQSQPEFVPAWLLGCADVDRAFYRCGLTKPERVVLELVHRAGYTPGELAEAWQEPAERVDATAQSGIRKIRNYVNGEAPA